jgi:hypothetical protein
VDARLTQDPEAVYTEYENLNDDPWCTLVISALGRMKRAEVAEADAAAFQQVVLDESQTDVVRTSAQSRR